MRRHRFCQAIVLLALSLFSARAHAIGRLDWEQIMTGATVNATATVTTSTVSLTNKVPQYLLVLCQDAGGTADVKIEQQYSVDNATFSHLDGDTDLVSSTAAWTQPETLHRIVLPPTPGTWVKYGVTGTASNPATTTCSVWFVYRRADR